MLWSELLMRRRLLDEIKLEEAQAQRYAHHRDVIAKDDRAAQQALARG